MGSTLELWLHIGPLHPRHSTRTRGLQLQTYIDRVALHQHLHLNSGFSPQCHDDPKPARGLVYGPFQIIRGFMHDYGRHYENTNHIVHMVDAATKVNNTKIGYENMQSLHALSYNNGSGDRFWISYAQQLHDSTSQIESTNGSLSLSYAHTLSSIIQSARHQTKSQTSKTNKPRQKRQWHQDQSRGYVSVCHSGSQGTVRPPIKSRLAVGCRAESVRQSRHHSSWHSISSNPKEPKKEKSTYKKKRKTTKKWDLQELCWEGWDHAGVGVGPRIALRYYKRKDTDNHIRCRHGNGSIIMHVIIVITASSSIGAIYKKE
ncbi:hypothetical protein O0I10_006287 [Lichtheimia ornata]|uniref:Uncharacterized protein n=1 Tax=Lichtheimia ornata TaxID=688661 RepID=A0AAD7V5J7_9FUNG|nr:uncharacterized protein O0I10_006287 [Lichtheimia ornata]KAJ8658016.1 hypothetical protein O0I10_006287 [Lichtheimia ornata]